MSDSDGKKTLGLRGGARPGNVKQSFSHGRTKNVVAETKRKRVVVPKPGGQKPTGPGAGPIGDPKKRPAGITDAEMERRLKAVQAAKAREVEEAAAREAEEKARAEERERRRAEIEAKEREEREREESLKAKAEEDARRKAEAEAAAAAPAPEPAAAREPGSKPAPAATPRKTTDRDRDDSKKRSKGGDSRRAGKLTVNQALAGGEGGRQRSMAQMKRKQERARQKAMGGQVEREKIVRDVQLPPAIVVSELANRMAERTADVVKELMKLGVMATATQTVDGETAELIAQELGHRAQRVSDSDVESGLEGADDDEASLKPRPPVVTVMGHVDHGKTSLLDAIRRTDVAAGESGGITQHIGAYQINTASGNLITFIDTPGHEAFTEMRSRGANITDIVILVVAADDSVMVQTVEAINHAKAAGCPVIVAVNKCDKPEADPKRVRNDLLQHEIITEDFGGDVLCVDVSAITGQGLDKLEEAIMLQAELLELKANPDRAATGVVVEAKVERGRGSVATLLVQRGTLKQGDIFVIGAESGRVRAFLMIAAKH